MGTCIFLTEPKFEFVLTLFSKWRNSRMFVSSFSSHPLSFRWHATYMI